MAVFETYGMLTMYLSYIMQSNTDDHNSTTVARNLKLSIKPAKCGGNFFASKRFK